MRGCPSGLQNVDRRMPMSFGNFFECIPQIREGKSADGGVKPTPPGDRGSGSNHLRQIHPKNQSSCCTLRFSVPVCPDLGAP